MKIVIADIYSYTVCGKRTGHYYALARNYKAMFGDNCIIAGGPVYKDEFKDENLMVLPYNVKLGQNAFKVRLKNFVNAMALFKRAEGECIVLQQCATITTFLCVWLFYHKKSRLYFIQYSLEGFRMKLGKILYRFAKHKFDGIICPNDAVGKAYDIPYCVVPDYIFTDKSFDINKLVPYSEKKYDFGILGRISPEKGVVETIRKFVGTKYKVLIAGNPQTNELKESLIAECEEAANIELKLEYISDGDYTSMLSQCRYSLLNYQGEYSSRSSGVVLDMIFSGIPVVGRRCQALDFIDKNSIGYIYENIEEFNPEDIFNEKIYNEYLLNIKKYCEKQREYIKKIGNFIMGKQNIQNRSMNCQF